MTAVVCSRGPDDWGPMTTDEASPVALRVTVAGDQEPVVVTAVGELDMSTLAVFVAILDEALEAGPDVVELNLSALTFIDSSGVGAYVAAFRRARANGTQLT